MATGMENFGAALKRIRMTHDLSLRQLGMKYGRLIGKPDGVANSVIANWESGMRNPSQTVISLLCQAIGCTDGERNELLIAAGFLPQNALELIIGGVTVSLYSANSSVSQDDVATVYRALLQHSTR